MATKKVNIKKPTINHKKVTLTAKVVPNDANVQFRDLLMKISSATYNEEREFPESWPDEAKNKDEVYGNHFLWGSSQVNSDLALAAQCEAEYDVSREEVFDFTRSPQFWKLRQQFVKDASQGDDHSLLHLVWRAYNSGRLSPDRLVPRTPEERLSHRMGLHATDQEAAKPLQ
jgi:hypothetical protein